MKENPSSEFGSTETKASSEAKDKIKEIIKPQLQKLLSEMFDLLTSQDGKACKKSTCGERMATVVVPYTWKEVERISNEARTQVFGPGSEINSTDHCVVFFSMLAMVADMMTRLVTLEKAVRKLGSTTSGNILAELEKILKPNVSSEHTD